METFWGCFSARSCLSWRGSRVLTVIGRTLDGLQATIKVSEWDTVSGLKSLLAPALGIPKLYQIVARGGTVLADESTLAELNVDDGAQFSVERREHFHIKLELPADSCLHANHKDGHCWLAKRTLRTQYKWNITLCNDEFYKISFYRKPKEIVLAVEDIPDVGASVIAQVVETTDDPEQAEVPPSQRWIIAEAEPGRYFIEHVVTKRRLCVADIVRSMYESDEAFHSDMSRYYGRICLAPLDGDMSGNELWQFPCGSLRSFFELVENEGVHALSADGLLTVNVTSLAGEQIATLRMDPSATLEQLRKQVARELKRSPLRMFCDGEELQGTSTLAALGICNGTSIQTLFCLSCK